MTNVWHKADIIVGFTQEGYIAAGSTFTLCLTKFIYACKCADASMA